ncbi:hypothetical protein CG002_00040 [Mesoplasma florum]|uniref:hypothetical protein n=1 Tax=Mesoplasma florum TaxID=2151 RepID=UPI000D08C038|nr:hypothetical protein [Mesoplasma florum]AVN64764.1 hypothetical protein CG002_00040 [Mesoplasma florum]
MNFKEKQFTREQFLNLVENIIFIKGIAQADKVASINEFERYIITSSSFEERAIFIHFWTDER